MGYVNGDEVEELEVAPGLFASFLLDGAQGAYGVSLLRGRLKPGSCHSSHTHDCEEAVVFLSGSGVVSLDDKRHNVYAGDALLIPPLTPHSTYNTSTSEDLHFVAAFSDSILMSKSLEENKAKSFRTVKGRYVAINKLRWVIRKCRQLWE